MKESFVPLSFVLKTFFFVLALFCTGCYLDQSRWHVPDIMHPGHIDDQTHNMRIADPLPSPFPGPGIASKCNGIRPRDADKPWDPASEQALSSIGVSPPEFRNTK